jgi:flagellar hook-length control protein FliK
VTSVASETVAYSSRTPQFQRSQASNQAQDNDSPFALMLEASAPPAADPAPRRPEPSEPAAPSQKAEAPADPKKKTKTDTPDSKAADPSEPAEDEPAAEDEVAVQVEAGSDTPVVEEVLPEIPETEETAEDSSKSPDAEIAIGQVQADTPQVQTAVAPEVAVAAPVAVTPEVVAPASGEGETAPDLAIKPTDAAGVPAAKSAPEAPVAAPIVDAPELPVELQAKGAKDIPEIKGKAELKPAELQAETAEQPVDAETQQVLPHQAKTEHARLNVQTEDAKPQQAESRPQSETQQSADPAQQKPVASQAMALDTDMTNTPLPTTQQPVATDVAALTGNQRVTTLMAQTPVPVSGIAVEIAAQAKAGNNRFEIRLDPPELGRIDVRLDVDQDGNVKSRLVIERSDTYDLLRKDSSTLERALQQAGLKTSDNGLEFTLRDQGSAQREARDQNQRNTERGIIPDADILPAEAASGYGRVLGLGSGVDIRI